MAHASGIANPNPKNLIDEMAEKEEMVTKSREQGSGLVNGEIDYGPHVDS